MNNSRPSASARRLGRAVVHIHQHDTGTIRPDVAVEIETLLLAGRAMDLAARLKSIPVSQLTPRVVGEFAKKANIGPQLLLQTILPALKQADVIDYGMANGQLTRVEELVGVTGSLLEQTVRVLEALMPSDVERAVQHSVEIASWAPLTRSQHLAHVASRGFSDGTATMGLRLALAIGVNLKEPSIELREDVIYNPYVWNTGQVKIAAFLRSLPPGERDVLLGVCEQASDRPGLALPHLQGTPSIVNSARKVGLIQATTVKSTGGASVSSQTYVFSPMLDSEDDKLQTTEALHQRKLFVAHILFGHEKALAGRGRIRDPIVLVGALVRNGEVGPATNIATDYRLLEAQGIVAVEEVGSSGRAFLRLVKDEIVRDGLDWLERTMPGSSGGTESPKLLRSPGTFISPEQDRALIGDQGEADEIARSAVLRLREEMVSALRQDN